MKRKYLEDLGLEKEAIDSIMAEHGKAVTAVKADLTEAQTKITNLEESISKRDTDIEKLKKEGGTSEELKKQLETLQVQYDTDKANYEADLIQTKKNSAIELALTNAKARNIKATKALLDTEALELGDDGVKGLDDQLKKLQEENPFLFDSEEPKETKPEPTPQIVVGGNPSTDTGSTPKSWRELMNENVAKAKQAAAKT